MRIAISGSQCQGKSTLCNDIITTWPTFKKSPESYRKIVKEQNLPTNKHATKDSQRKILNSICDDIKLYKKGDKVIFDRCGLDNLIYSLWSMDKGLSDIDNAFITECVELVKESMRNIDIILYTPITKVAPVEVEEREDRDIDIEYITEIDNLFKAVSYQHLTGKCPFFHRDDAPPIIEIFGSREERIHLLKYYIDLSGELIETTSSVLDIDKMQDMENLIRDQKEQFAIENKDKLIKKGIIHSKFNK